MNIHDIINDLSLSNGESKRMACPSCKTNNTFTITNDMGNIVWNCYKNSCPISGATRTGLTADDIRKSLGSVAEETHVASFSKPAWLVRDYEKITGFCDEWELDPQDLGLLYDVKEHRVVFPVVHNGTTVDATGRSLGKRIPKWKRYGNSHLPYSYGRGKTAVVVEDCISAAVIGDGGVYVGVAVLGTSLSTGHKRYLSQFSTAIIALDPDALQKTLQFAKELRTHVDTVKVIYLRDDLKYRNPSDLNHLTTLGE